MGFSAILLDVGGVFVIPDQRLILATLSSADVVTQNPDTDRAHYVAVAAVDRDEGSGDPYLQAYLTALGVGAEDRSRALDAVVGLFKQPSVELWQQVVVDSVEALRTMATLGIRLGIVSNSDGTVERQLLRHRICQVGPGACTEVLAIIDSGVVGVAKPDPAVFASAVAAVGRPVGEIAFVGDSVRYDVRGAEAAGLVPIHFDPHGLCQSAHRHDHVRALSDLCFWTGASSVSRSDLDDAPNEPQRQQRGRQLGPVRSWRSD